MRYRRRTRREMREEDAAAFEQMRRGLTAADREASCYGARLASSRSGVEARCPRSAAWWPARWPVPSPEPAASHWMARGEHELPDGASWLTAREAARAGGMRFTKRRREYLLRRFAGKRAVAAAVGLPTDPAELSRIEVANRPSGAPYVLVDGAPLGLDVSLTDRAGWAVCVVGADLSRVGCDLEIVEPRSRGFVTDFLTGPEQEYVAAAPDRDAAANLLWSAKESALKVLRTGLRRDTRSVEVSLREPGPGTGWGPMAVTSEEGMRMPGWWRREGRFLLTMAADRDFPEPAVLPGAADLMVAEPVHSWVGQPLADAES